MDPSEQIDRRIEELGDWRGEMVARLRGLIRQAAPELQEAWKWSSPTWTYHGNVLSVGAFKNHVKVNFFKGAGLADPHGLFNAGEDAKATRSIDFHEGDEVDETALQELIRAAVALDGAAS